MLIKPIGIKSSSQNFTSSKDDIDLLNTKSANAFVNMDDNQVKRLAYRVSYDRDHEKKKRNSMLATFYAMPVAASVASGVFTKGDLGTRVGASARTGAHWGFGLIMLGVYNSIKNSIVSKSPALQNFSQNNPFLAVITDLAVFFGVATLGFRGAEKIAKKIGSETPEMVARFDAKKALIKQQINNSKANKEILPSLVDGMAKFSKKAPLIAGLGRFTLANSVFILLIAGLMKGSKYSREDRDKVATNYNNLKNAQLEVAKALKNEAEENRIVMVKTVIKPRSAEKIDSNEIKMETEREIEVDSETKEGKEASECCTHSDDEEIS